MASADLDLAEESGWGSVQLVFEDIGWLRGVVVYTSREMLAVFIHDMVLSRSTSAIKLWYLASIRVSQRPRGSCELCPGTFQASVHLSGFLERPRMRMQCHLALPTSKATAASLDSLAAGFFQGRRWSCPS